MTIQARALVTCFCCNEKMPKQAMLSIPIQGSDAPTILFLTDAGLMPSSLRVFLQAMRPVVTLLW